MAIQVGNCKPEVLKPVSNGQAKFSPAYKYDPTKPAVKQEAAAKPGPVPPISVPPAISVEKKKILEQAKPISKPVVSEKPSVNLTTKAQLTLKQKKPSGGSMC